MMGHGRLGSLLDQFVFVELNLERLRSQVAQQQSPPANRDGEER